MVFFLVGFLMYFVLEATIGAVMYVLFDFPLLVACTAIGAGVGFLTYPIVGGNMSSIDFLLFLIACSFAGFGIGCLIGIIAVLVHFGRHRV